MKKIILYFGLLNCYITFSQNLKTVLNESFDNNSNKWEISEKKYWKTFISNGSYFLSNNELEKFSYFKGNNLNINNKEKYEIDVNLKINTLEENSFVGLIFINDEKNEKNNYFLLQGYMLMFLKYQNDYFLHLNKYDHSGYNFDVKLNNFDINKTHNIKVIIDNSIPKTSIFIDNSLVLEKDFPLFNFNNIGFSQVGKVSMKVNDLKIKTSINENNDFMFDIIDKIYVKSKNTSITLKGSHYVEQLLNYVPTAILQDDFEGQFNRFKDELLIDENCVNFKTTPTNDGINDAFTFDYKTNKVFTLVSKENTFIATSITFAEPNKAIEFYNLYSKSKGFIIKNERAYFPNNEMKAILLTKEDNRVTIFY
jgi:hypothetical protein